MKTISLSLVYSPSPRKVKVANIVHPPVTQMHRSQHIRKPKGLSLKEAHLNALAPMVSGEGQEEGEPRTSQNREVTEMKPGLLETAFLQSTENSLQA